MTHRPSSAQKCPNCGHAASGKFCNSCGKPLHAGACKSCGADLPPGSRFCNDCGTPVDAGSTPARQSARSAGGGQTSPAVQYAPWVLSALLIVSVVAYFIVNGKGGGSAPDATMAAGAAPFAQGGGSGGAPPDISSMSPRERAARLYDRIMRYSEEKKMDSVQVFAPMAMASFEMLGPELDLDARYDYGRVASETGNYAVAMAQADTILKQSPNHLLGLSLSARTAELQKNPAAASKAWKAFLAAKDTELKKKLPEYEAHATDIELSTRIATGK